MTVWNVLPRHLVSLTVNASADAGARSRTCTRWGAAAPSTALRGSAMRAGAARPVTVASAVTVALLAGVALLGAMSLALLAPPAGAAPLTSGFIVPVPSSTTGSLAAAPANVLNVPALNGSALRERFSHSLRATVAPDGRPATRVDTGSRFDMIGILFRTTPAGVRTVEFRLRVSLDGTTWTPWFAVKADAQSGPAGSVCGKSDLVTEPVWVGAARFVDYEVITVGAGAAPVSDVRLACVDSEVTTAVSTASPVAPAATASLKPSFTAAAPTTTAQLGTAKIAGRLAAPAKPPIVTRAKWGADEAYRTGSPSYGVVRCAFVHHTVNANTYTRAQAPALVRGIYYYHTQVNGWWDIGYNFLIDRFGTIYEGRYGGVTKAVLGAQVLGFNSWSTGVALIGTFETAAPSPAAVSSLERLLSWKLDLSHLNPRGTARIRCSTAEMYKVGQWVTVPVILGHRQVNYTECPGDVLFGMLPAIRKTVAGLGDPKIFTPTASPAAFSPNGDGARDTATLKAVLSGPDHWAIAVSDASGAVVTHFSGMGSTIGVVWDGRDDAGRRLPDGSYLASFTATSANGTARPASVALRIDTVRPVISSLTLSPAVISPNGDHLADTARLAFGVNETSRLSLTVLDAKGVAVRVVTAAATASGARQLTWDGKVSSAGGLVAAADGTYSVVVRATDVAGNAATARRVVTVDDTLGHPVAAPLWLSPNGDGVRDTTVVLFRTTRSAKIGLVFAASNGTTVRRVALGRLAAGRHAWSWDATSAGGATVADGGYTCTLTAVNAVGTVAVPVRVHVDTAPPVAAWHSGSVKVKLGKRLNAVYSVADNESPTAAVTIVASSASGATVASVSRPAVATGVGHTWAFKPKARGRYTVLLRAVDRAGNRQTVVARLIVTVT
jgi:flagellar hook assembly protein FlgD